ncbi:MAG: type II toxin-antitoxin system VapC family toxin [Actinobacteria bacterium]|nr:type II toxin-antitoxin system VapC family toxin [Actinomycetota bacterium]
MKLYLDASAIVKLVQREAESEALRRYLRRHRADLRVTSALSRVEVVRAVLPGGSTAVGHAQRQLGRLHQIALGLNLLDDAATIAPEALLRSLDAVHVVSAQLLGDDLRALITYDQRMSDTAALLGLPTAAPS